MLGNELVYVIGLGSVNGAENWSRPVATAVTIAPTRPVNPVGDITRLVSTGVAVVTTTVAVTGVTMPSDAVMVTVPTATPVTTPVELLTVAMAVLDDV